jgi:hypothetical protein
MKTIISAIIVAGALSQMANAMGPMGDNTHRHFYKDQEWIWQKDQTQPKAGENANAITQPASNGASHAPVTFFVPHNPSVAFFVPHNPSVAFFVPHNPSVAFFVPHNPSVAFFVPHNPSVAFFVPHNPSVAFFVPHNPSVAFFVPHNPSVA